MTEPVSWATPMTRAERHFKRADELLSFNRFDEALIEIEKAKRELTTASIFILNQEKAKRDAQQQPRT